MKAMVLERGNLGRLLGSWADSRRVLVPGPAPDFPGFVPLSGDAVELPPVSTVRSAKEALFARSEPLFGYRWTGDDVELAEPGPVDGAVLFGLRPCDARALSMLDEVFCEDPADTRYQERRDKTVLVVMACNNPGPACFCTSVGGDPHDRTGADVLVIDTGDHLILEPVTDRGAELMAGSDLLRPADEGQVEAGTAAAGAARERMPEPVAVDGVCERLDDMFEHPYWQTLHDRCLGCGACTYLCPTCHCFDVVDERGRDGYVRFRNWDSCQFGKFTVHGSGHNPRSSGLERMRQRVMHKFNHHPHRYGKIACVGCGRCVASCPVNFDIRQVVREIGGIG